MEEIFILNLKCKTLLVQDNTTTYILVITDELSRSASYPSYFNCSSTGISITRINLVKNFLVPKKTGAVSFLQTLKNWNSSIWTRGVLIWTKSIPTSLTKWGNGIRERTEGWTAADKLHNRRTYKVLIKIYQSANRWREW